ncbi:MAG: hypothetical protein RBS85_01390 [Methanofastidiosum sp.]|jgi:hypothetical protein|nr:hypothetical protein [Methanofastidiosum sp.]
MDSLIDFALKREYERLQKLGNRLNDIISLIARNCDTAPLIIGPLQITASSLLDKSKPIDIITLSKRMA